MSAPKRKTTVTQPKYKDDQFNPEQKFIEEVVSEKTTPKPAVFTKGMSKQELEDFRLSLARSYKTPIDKIRYEFEENDAIYYLIFDNPQTFDGKIHKEKKIFTIQYKY